MVKLNRPFRQTAALIAAGILFVSPAASATKTHVECAFSEKCADGVCERIKAEPILLRFLQVDQTKAIMGYASALLVGGPLAEEGYSSLFGWNITNGVTLMLGESQFSITDSLMWANLRSPQGDRQRLLIGNEVLRTVGEQKVTPAQLVSPQSEELLPKVDNGFSGECRWHLDVSLDDATKRDGTSNG